MPNNQTSPRKSYELPLLKAIADMDGSVTVPSLELQDRVAALAGWKDENWDATHARPKWVYELQWVRYNLVKSGDLDGSSRGVWKITDQGHKRLAHDWSGYAPSHPPPLDRSFTDDVFCELCYADIQTVAQDDLGRTLTPEELTRVANAVPDYLHWHDVISSAITGAKIPE